MGQGTNQEDRRAGWVGSGSGFPNNCRLVSGIVFVRRPVDRNGINLGTRGLKLFGCLRGRSFRLRACGRPVISFAGIFISGRRLRIPNMESPCSMNVIGSQWPFLFQIFILSIITVSLHPVWRDVTDDLMNGRSVCVALEMDGTCVGRVTLEDPSLVVGI